VGVSIILHRALKAVSAGALLTRLSGLSAVSAEAVATTPTATPAASAVVLIEPLTLTLAGLPDQHSQFNDAGQSRYVESIKSGGDESAGGDEAMAWRKITFFR